jgi:hypothetical protein
MTAGMPSAQVRHSPGAEPVPGGRFQSRLLPGDEPMSREISRQDGVLLAVTHVADPHSPDVGDQFSSAFRGGRMLCGWISLAAG